MEVHVHVCDGERGRKRWGREMGVGEEVKEWGRRHMRGIEWSVGRGRGVIKRSGDEE